MASIRKRGENSYLLVVSRGYDYQGNRLKPVQKTVHPPKGLTAKQTEKWLNEQAVLYEREVKRTPGEPVDRSITLAKYIDVWLEQVAPKKLAASTLVRDKQDIRRILPALGHYKLAELNKDILRAFYDAMRSEQNWKTGGLLAEKTVEGIHSCLCGILSDAVEAGYITHNPAWRAYRKKGAPQERPVADEETVQRLITALEGQSLKYEVYFKLILATGMRRGEACGLRWSDIDWRQRALHIRRNVVKLSGQPILVKEPKTRAGVRVVYLSKELCKLLRVWQKESAWEKEQRGGGELEEEDYLFRQPGGDPMVPSTFTFRFKKILREGNLPDNLNVHVETENLDMVREAVEAGADIIMLDNMTPDEMAEAIRIIDGRAETECSGNMTKENIATITKLGVDYVSSGALTHSAPILDLSLKHLRAL